MICFIFTNELQSVLSVKVSAVTQSLKMCDVLIWYKFISLPYKVKPPPKPSCL